MGASPAVDGEDAVAAVGDDDDEVARGCARFGPNASSHQLAWFGSAHRDATGDGFAVDDGNTHRDCQGGEKVVGRSCSSSDRRCAVVVVISWGPDHRIGLGRRCAGWQPWLPSQTEMVEHR
ncbi:hypothetical protein ACLOJK_029420 [Asimina triloba]